MSSSDVTNHRDMSQSNYVEQYKKDTDTLLLLNKMERKLGLRKGQWQLLSLAFLKIYAENKRIHSESPRFYRKEPLRLTME